MKVRFAVSVGLSSPDPQQLGAVVEEVERRGFDTLWLSDVPSVPSTEPSLGLAYAAACTRKVRLGANFIPFGLQPYLLAHRLAQLDHLTGGRLLITFVPGLDLPGEREALGTAGRHRGEMMEKLVPDLHRLWADGIPVRPVQQPLEIWLAGAGPDAIRRAGRVSDGWLGSMVSPNRAGQIRQAIQDEAARVGRTIDPEHFGLSIGYARQPEDIDRAVRLRIRRPLPENEADISELVPVGGEALRRLLGQLADHGLSKFVLRPLAPVADWAAELAWLADTVLDLQT
jgi:alkanesulfonate monooxygenase SsuD/methylene tetrahydromethanopterin reductase-like flavin-dependent oxidoreductase (luciferase family)